MIVKCVWIDEGVPDKLPLVIAFELGESGPWGGEKGRRRRGGVYPLDCRGFWAITDIQACGIGKGT